MSMRVELLMGHQYYVHIYNMKIFSVQEFTKEMIILYSYVKIKN